MTFTTLLTVTTDLLITITLIYCIVLERRIRAFREQEQTFRTLMGDVAESTRAAQSAVSSLRHLLHELGNRSATIKSTSEPALAPRMAEPSAPRYDRPVHSWSDEATPERGMRSSSDYVASDHPVSVLTSRLAALRTRQAVG